MQVVGSFTGDTGSSSTASVSCTLTSVQAGDLVVCAVSVERSTATAGTPVTGVPNTFTSDANSTGTTMAWSYSHYTLVSGDITAGACTVTSTVSTSTRRQAISCTVFRAWNSVAFVGGSYTENGPGVVTATTPSITPNQDNATLVAGITLCSNVTPYIRTQSVNSPYTMGGNDGSSSASATNAYVGTATYTLTGGNGSSQSGGTYNDTTLPTPTKFAWYAGTWAVEPIIILSDSGSANDGGTAIALTASDSGAGSDTLYLSSASSTVIDSGAAADVMIISAAIAVSNSGAGTDTLNSAVSQILIDSGSESKALRVSATATLSDSGAGSDNVNVNVGTVAVTLSDSSSEQDALLVAAAQPLADSGTAGDLLSVGSPVTLADSGASGAALLLSTTTTLADSGAAGDTTNVSATATLSDSGSGTDTVSVAQGNTPTLSDSGAVNDALSSTASLTVTDSGSSTDTLSTLQNIALTLADSGTANDKLTVSAAVPLTDTASETDSVGSNLALTTLIDSGAGTDTVNVQQGSTPFLTNGGTGQDILSVSVAVPLADTGSANDLANLGVPVTATDSGSGTDHIAIAISQTATLSDSGTGIDALLGTAQVTLNDLAIAAEQESLSALLNLSEGGSGNDTVSYSSSMTIYLTDRGIGTEGYPNLVSGALPSGGGWWHLDTILRTQAELKTYYDMQEPVACPKCGEPIKQGPPQASGRVSRFCPFGHFQFPNDWDVSTMSGM